MNENKGSVDLGSTNLTTSSLQSSAAKAGAPA